MVMSDWLAKCKSTNFCEQRLQSEVLYVIPITSIFGRLALVPVGDTGTIPFSMRKEASTFPGAACNSKLNRAYGNQLWYFNRFALKWASSQ